MKTRNYENQLKKQARRELIEEQICFIVWHVVVISTLFICLFW